MQLSIDAVFAKSRPIHFQGLGLIRFNFRMIDFRCSDPQKLDRL